MKCQLTDIKEREIMEKAFSNGIHKIIISADGKNDTEKLNSLKTAKNKIIGDLWVSEEAADFFAEVMIYVMGWKVDYKKYSANPNGVSKENIQPTVQNNNQQNILDENNSQDFEDKLEQAEGCLSLIGDTIKAICECIFGGFMQVILFGVLVLWLLSKIFGGNMGDILSDIMRFFN